MASPFWAYFADTLRWPQAFSAGVLQSVVRGLAHHLDSARSDVPYLREQFLPEHCEARLIPLHGTSRGLVRHPRETEAQFRQRVISAYRWHMLGGKVVGLPEILDFYGFKAIRIDNLRRWQPSKWAEFQLGLETPLTQVDQEALLRDMEILIWLVNEYKPARSVLRRIYTDTYDVPPTVWSDGTAWSEGFWSRFSGVTLPGGGDIVVSFGMPYRALCEAYNPDVGLGTTARHGMLIPYVDRPIWSQSNWSEIYAMGSGFTVGELLSLHWCVKQVVSSPWLGAWDTRHWAELATWDRPLPSWSLVPQAWCRAQAVHSWAGMDTPCGRDGAYGDINACYSLPSVTILGEPPSWSRFAYSEEAPHVQHMVIKEQHHEQRGFAAELVKPSAALAGFGLAMTAKRRLQLPYGDHAVWSQSRWSEVFPRNHSMTVHAVSRSQFCDRVLAAQGWSGGWSARPWAKTAGWDRPLPAWSMVVRTWAYPQAVYAWAEAAYGAYGDINACYSLPSATIFGVPPSWSASAYSEDSPKRQEVSGVQRSRDVLCVQLEAPPERHPAFGMHHSTLNETWRSNDE